MKHYDYQKQLRILWEKAVKLHGEGRRDAGAFFSSGETAFLGSIGVSEQEMYDFAEDYNGGGEPDFPTVAMMQDIRRAYFLETQKGRRSGRVIDTGGLPPKKEDVRGIRWLPRVIAKAKAKLRGELPPDLMYCCGGDRNFFRENDIHPAEFLRAVRENEDNDAAVVDWVEARRKTMAGRPDGTGGSCSL